MFLSVDHRRRGWPRRWHRPGSTDIYAHRHSVPCGFASHFSLHRGGGLCISFGRSLGSLSLADWCYPYPLKSVLAPLLFVLSFSLLLPSLCSNLLQVFLLFLRATFCAATSGSVTSGSALERSSIARKKTDAPSRTRGAPAPCARSPS